MREPEIFLKVFFSVYLNYDKIGHQYFVEYC